MTSSALTLFAVHGAGMHAGIWGMLLPLLADQPFQALTLPGHAATGEAPLDNIGDMAEWVRGRLADRPAQSVILLGHSMGALVALEAAAHPAVAGVILMGAAAQMPVNPDLLKLAADDPAAAGEMILKYGLNPDNADLEELKAFMRKLMQAGAGGVIFSDLKACDNYTSGMACVSALQKPLLVICGERDKLTRAAEGVALAGMAAVGESDVLVGCGHMMMVERPAETALLIRQFLEKFK